MTWVTQARLATRPVPSGAMAHGRRVSYRSLGPCDRRPPGGAGRRLPPVYIRLCEYSTLVC